MYQFDTSALKLVVEILKCMKNIQNFIEQTQNQCEENEKLYKCRYPHITHSMNRWNNVKKYKK